MTDDDVVQRFGGAISRTGWFSHDLRTGAWSWSDVMYRIHGYESGEVELSSDLMLQHKHPEDRGIVVAARERAYTSTEPVSCSHRIVTRDGELRSVVTVARTEPAADGGPGRLLGFMTDLTESRVSDSMVVAAEAVESATGSRAVIEQAKGALMLTYGIDEGAAFNVLRRHSQHRNVRLVEVAAALVAAFADPGWVVERAPEPDALLDRYLVADAPGGRGRRPGRAHDEDRVVDPSRQEASGMS
ncbi:PAS and ANTAR domain-containing protein [Aquipuribacter hungaricus]|uniref:histidine kinase n=1 Tax=Aquipuribacter hungaricus TaxID=545624 RepID=A0ABV7WCL5_9MICO